MKIGWIGAGKLGLTCALVDESKGHEVVVYDPSPQVKVILETKKLPYREIGAQELLDTTRIRSVSIQELVEFSDMIFVAVQTPHDPRYEGNTRIPEERVDFDYNFLIQACKDLNESISNQDKNKPVVIISTVIPGTIDREIKPWLSPKFKLGYSPKFIAMGTCAPDYLNPEFILFGIEDEDTARLAEKFYQTICPKSPFYQCSTKSAELIKVAYNTFISTKLAFVNNLMEICHYTGADVDEVTDALKLATERLISTKYMTAGLGDGGGCHPRDNIALSWLSRKLGMTFDFHEAIMIAREKQTEFLANLVDEHRYHQADGGEFGLPVMILGKAFKEQTNMVVGSPSILLKNILEERGVLVEMYDPWVDNAEDKTVNPYASGAPRLFFIGTHHAVFQDYIFPLGSTVIDPWRMIQDQAGVKVVRVGQAL